jgi:hypothetical protein
MITNPSKTWESETKMNLGLEATLFKQVDISLDIFNNNRRNILSKSSRTIPQYLGFGMLPDYNLGKTNNKGLEVMIRYNIKQTGAFQYFVEANAWYAKNKIIYNAEATQIADYLYRTGHIIDQPFMLEAIGLFKDQSDVNGSPLQIFSPAHPGDIKYKDQNGDEIIDESDKVFLGSPVPWLIGGIDFGFSYRNLDINLALQGQYGNKILNAKRMNRDIFVDGNYDRDFYENRWSSERISSDYPSAEAYNFSFIQQANDFFIESGAYIRIQNVQIGYNIKDLSFIPMLRIYVAAQRPYTFFTYRGFTPEVGGSPISSAIDNSVYPMQSIYTIGAKMSF